MNGVWSCGGGGGEVGGGMRKGKLSQKKQTNCTVIQLQIIQTPPQRFLHMGRMMPRLSPIRSQHPIHFNLSPPLPPFSQHLQFARDPKLVAGEVARTQRKPDISLVAVRGGGVDVAIARPQGRGHEGGGRGERKRAQPERGHARLGSGHGE